MLFPYFEDSMIPTGCIHNKDNYPHIKEAICVRLLISLPSHFYIRLQRDFSVGNIHYAFYLTLSIFAFILFFLLYDGSGVRQTIKSAFDY